MTTAPTLLTDPQGQSLIFGDSGSHTVYFSPFDTSLGTLQAVIVTVTAQIIDPLFSVQNNETATAAFQVSLPVDISAATSNRTLGMAVLDPNASLTLPGTSGTAPLSSFAGSAPSGGMNLIALSATDPDRALFTGSGIVPVSVQASLSAFYSGPGNALISSSDLAGAQVSLQYDYSAPGTPVGTGGSGGVIITSGPPITLIPLFPVGSVTTAPQTVVIPDQVTSWSDATRTVQQFDPSLGTLESVNIALTGDETGSIVTIDSAPSGSGTVGGVQSASVLLAVPSGTFIQSSATSTYGAAIPAGQTQTLPAAMSPTPSSEQLTDAAVLAAFTGTGAVALPLSATSAASLALPNDQTTTLATLAGATAVVSYTYLPAALVSAECFAAGTRLAVPEGERLVEDLREGDQVLTASGAVARVVWVGRRRVDCRRHPRPRDVQPVRIRAHAFAADVPRRDVLLSPDHAVFMEGVLIPVRHLIDGGAVAQLPMDEVTYFHVELERHDVLVADGLPAESYLDVGARAAFVNGGAVVQAAPDFASRVWEAEGCAPLAVAGPEVERVRARLAARTLAAAA